MACRWQPGMKITALLDALNSALAEPFALAWSQDSPRFLLVFTAVYAVAVIVAVTDQRNTRPGAEHGSAAWGDVFRLNKFYMDKRGPNLLLTQHFHIGIDGYKHKHNTNICQIYLQFCWKKELSKHRLQRLSAREKNALSAMLGL